MFPTRLPEVQGTRFGTELESRRPVTSTTQWAFVYFCESQTFDGSHDRGNDKIFVFATRGHLPRPTISQVRCGAGNPV